MQVVLWGSLPFPHEFVPVTGGTGVPVTVSPVLVVLVVLGSVLRHCAMRPWGMLLNLTLCPELCGLDPVPGLAPK